METGEQVEVPMEEEQQKRKRGRPKGSKNKLPSKKRKEGDKKPKKQKVNPVDKPKHAHRLPDEIPNAFGSKNFATGIVFGYDDKEGSRLHLFQCWNNKHIMFFYSFISNSKFNEEKKTRSYDKGNFLRYSHTRDFFYIGYYPIQIEKAAEYYITKASDFVQFHKKYPRFPIVLDVYTAPPLPYVYHGLADTAITSSTLEEDGLRYSLMDSWFWDYMEPLEDAKNLKRPALQFIPGFPCVIALDAFGNFDKTTNVKMAGSDRLISLRANFSCLALSLINPIDEDGSIKELDVVNLREFYSQGPYDYRLKCILRDQAYLLANFCLSLQDKDSRYKGRSYLPGSVVGLHFYFYLPAKIEGIDKHGKPFLKDAKRYMSIRMRFNGETEEEAKRYQQLFDDYYTKENNPIWYERFSEIFSALLQKQFNWWLKHDDEKYDWFKTEEDDFKEDDEHITWLDFDEMGWNVVIFTDEDRKKLEPYECFVSDEIDWNKVHEKFHQEELQDFVGGVELPTTPEIERYKNVWADEEGKLWFNDMEITNDEQVTFADIWQAGTNLWST